MQGYEEYPVVPMGRMSMGNALNGNPRRRVPQGGTKLNTKVEERKKPSLKDVLGVTPLDVLGNVSAADLPSPVKLFQKLLGTSGAEATDPQPEEPQPEEQEQQEAAHSFFQQQQQHPAPLLHHQQPHEDTRTNLEKYMGMKMQGLRNYAQSCPITGPPSPYYAPNPYMSQSPMAPAISPSFKAPIPTTAEMHNWGFQGAAPEYQTQYNVDDGTAYQQASSIGTSAPMGATVDQYTDPSQHNYAQGPIQYETAPAWFQHKSYVPQVPQYSHMTAPIPGAPFHPGFSYATDFKYYYNYYSADQYAGELDGGDATAQEEAVAREQQHAEELVSRQISQEMASATALKPIITSKKRLESGKAVAI